MISKFVVAAGEVLQQQHSYPYWCRADPELLRRLDCDPWTGLVLSRGDKAVWVCAEPWKVDADQDILVDKWILQYLGGSDEIHVEKASLLKKGRFLPHAESHLLERAARRCGGAVDAVAGCVVGARNPRTREVCVFRCVDDDRVASPLSEEIVDAWRRGRKYALLISGGSRSGKTTNLDEIGRDLDVIGIPYRHLRCKEVLLEISLNINQEIDDEVVLLVDDFQELTNEDLFSSSVRETLFQSLDHRRIVVVAASDEASWKKKGELTLKHVARYDRVRVMERPDDEERRKLAPRTVANACAGFSTGDVVTAAAFYSLSGDSGQAARRASPFAEAENAFFLERFDEERSWKGVYGCRAVKLEIEKALLWPKTKAEAFRRFGIRPPSGVLLHGPPGTGKTTLGRCVARLINKSLYFVSSAQLRREHLGESELLLRKLFEAARFSKSVLFFDEIDSIALARAGSNGSGLQSRLVTTLLVEMDGCGTGGDVVVLAATNRIHLLDRALLRPGRFELKLELTPPDLEDRLDTFRGLLSNYTKTIPRDLLDATEGFTYAQLASVVRNAVFRALDDKVDSISPDTILENIVEDLSAGRLRP